MSATSRCDGYSSRRPILLPLDGNRLSGGRVRRIYSTYWWKIAAGNFHGPASFTCMVSCCSPGVLLFDTDVARRRGRTMDHRNWGLAGIALFSFVLSSILAGQMGMLRAADARGMAMRRADFRRSRCARGRHAGFFAMAIAYSRRAQIHKRWMVLLMTGMMTPAIARVFLTLFAPRARPTGRRRRSYRSLRAGGGFVPGNSHGARLAVVGRPHPVYVYATHSGGAAGADVPFAATGAWMHIATAFERLSG